MSGIIKAVFGGGGDNGAADALALQQQQAAEAARTKADLEAQAQAARRVASGGGLRGLLSFVDDKLAKKLGG